MSVKVHEAYCLDSQQHRLLWWDDFLGDQIQGEWDTSGASVAVVDQQTGGIVRLTTGAATGNLSLIDWNDIRSLHVDQKISMEFRAKITNTSDVRVYFHLRFDFNNRISFYFLEGNANWQITTVDGGVPTSQDSGIAKDTDYHIFRIECFPTGEVHFYIDGTECANSPITTNIPDDATDFFQPQFYIETRVDSAKSMDIDYVVVRQEI